MQSLNRFQAPRRCEQPSVLPRPCSRQKGRRPAAYKRIGIALGVIVLCTLRYANDVSSSFCVGPSSSKTCEQGSSSCHTLEDSAILPRDRRLLVTALASTAALMLSHGDSAFARTTWNDDDEVSRPDLLPKGPAGQEVVIDLAQCFEKSQADRMREQIDKVERQIGYRLRILCQRSPDAPGNALKDYWKVDDNTIVVIADVARLQIGGQPNIMSFPRGQAVGFSLPDLYFSTIRGRYGTKNYVKKVGAGQAVFNAAANICQCLLQGECSDGRPIPNSELGTV